VAGLRCSLCGRETDADRLQGSCPDCSSPLLVSYDLEAVAATATRDDAAVRDLGIWRFAPLLPLRDLRNRVTLGEGGTPLLSSHAYASGRFRLWIKDESTNPTFTFKARGAAVGVSRAVELGARAVALSTAGNAGAAWAAYCARAGLRVVLAVPSDAPPAVKRECALYGAEVLEVDGSIADAEREISARSAGEEWFVVSTLKEPYRVEGKKTLAFEIASDLGWKAPDAVVYPTGGGVGLIGMYKGFSELLELGWIRGRMPRFYAVQAEGCAPIARAYEEGADRARPWEEPRTVAAGIRVPAARGDFLILRILRETGGGAVRVPESDIVAVATGAAREEGIAPCPEGAAALAAVPLLADRGWLVAGEDVVVVNTGAAVKYAEVLGGT